MQRIYIFLACLIALLLITTVALKIQNQKIPKLGLANGSLSPLSAKPNGVSSQAPNPDQKIDPWPVQTTGANDLAIITEIIQEHPQGQVIDQNGAYVRAVFKTSIMAWKDDVEFAFDAEANVIHLRSQSRVGYSDLGLNQSRLKALKQAYLAK